MNDISVIVPVYNGKETIEKCLFSLLNQSINVDIVVVDDGSIDNTKDIVLKMIENSGDRIHYYYKENSGISDARNFGVSKVETEYFGFLDSDDTVSKEMYEKMLLEIKRNNSDLCICNFYWVYEKDRKLAKDIGYTNKHEILEKMFATLWNKLYRTSWFKKTGLSFPSGFHYEDASVLYRLAYYMDKVCYVDEAFVNYYQRSGSITHTFTVYINDMIEVLEGIKKFYIDNNAYEEYKDEIEYLFIRFFLGNSYLRACRIKDKTLRKDVLDKGYDCLIRNYPNYKQNKYLKNSGLKNKYFSLLTKKTYYLNVKIFRILYALKIMK